MSKKLKPLTIFLSDDELINFKSHFDEFLNMNCDDKIKEQQQEIERLKENNQATQEEMARTWKKLDEKENIIKEVREYITSYESISTIQGLEDIEVNKDLDKKTLNEMVRRYMIVHDKILEILDKADKGEQK